MNVASLIKSVVMGVAVTMLSIYIINRVPFLSRMLAPPTK